MHNVFKNDPVDLRKRINKKVKVETKDDKIFEGTVYTIDPVSESIALLGNDNTLSIIFSRAVRTFDIIGNSEESSGVLLEDSNKQVLPKDVIEIRTKLKECLTKYMIPVVEEGDILKISDQVFITPPYSAENCISSNEVTLAKIQDLIRKISQDAS